MAKIIYAWELGGDYGHIGSFMPLALELREQGHEVIFVIRDLSNAEFVISKYKFQILQAPVWNSLEKGLPNPPLNYTEIILRYGFFNKLALSALNRAWMGLFSLIKPAIVIADHSPVALFTARALGIRRAVYGTGFCSPPHVSPMPNMRPWAKIPQKRLENADTHALAIMNSLLIDMKSPSGSITAIADLFKVDIDFLCTFPEMDHYPQRKDSTYWGPVFNVKHGKVLSWIEEGNQVSKEQNVTKRIFLYIKPQYKLFEKILSSLKTICLNNADYNAFKLDVLIFCPGVSPKIINEYQSEYFRFATEPIQLESILPKCDLTICHAGHGTVAASLIVGVPLLLLPMQLEQFMASLRIKQIGAAEIIQTDNNESPDFGLIIKNMLSNQIYKSQALAFAKKYYKFDQKKQFKLMANKLSEIIAAHN